MKPWAIFYRNGSTFRSTDGPPEMAPGGGVIAIAVESERVGQSTYTSCNYYNYDEKQGGWKGLDDPGYWQYMLEPGFKIIKYGQIMDNDEYRAFILRLKNDPHMKAKTARERWERPF